ncbi:hypothetical protein T4C_5569 [Trichinella pseudospiralis]|uniref:Uncharacterized protein n=1 Tax=Trichinella pseudospiralis TaxID=6337 RepID=A0A0V1IQY6_TRIPS|nr:hypothetical protein T4C_5569 [Trichinella pseudospiralis]
MHTGWRFYIGDVRYNCMQQLIAPSATCDSNAKDRTKLQLQFPCKSWTPTNTSGLFKKRWDIKNVRSAYIGDRVLFSQRFQFIQQLFMVECMDTYLFSSRLHARFCGSLLWHPG